MHYALRNPEITKKALLAYLENKKNQTLQKVQLCVVNALLADHTLLILYFK